jgi:hypothetical protein
MKTLMKRDVAIRIDLNLPGRTACATPPAISKGT